MKENSGAKLAGSSITSSCHACAFFQTKEEYYRVLVPFIHEGFQAGDKAFHILDTPDHPSHRKRLEESGVSVEEACKSGQLEIHNWEEAYLKPGYFDQDAMLALLESVLKESKSKGYPMTRLVANMEWACKHDIPGVKDIVRYEARLNHFLPMYEDAVVCTYDLNQHSATVVMDILRTHPQVLIGGIFQQNPYFVPPEELLKELQQRDI